MAYFFTYLSTSSTIEPFNVSAGGCMRWPNMDLFLGQLFDRVSEIKLVSNVHRYVRTYMSVRPKKMRRFYWFWAQRYRSMTDAWLCIMTWSKVKVTSLSRLEIRSLSKAISCTVYNGSWQLTTDSSTRTQYLNLIVPDYRYFRLLLCHVTKLAQTSVAKSQLSVTIQG